MNYKIVAIFLLLASCVAHGQPPQHWVRIFEHENYSRVTSNDLFRNSDNGYMIAGTALEQGGNEPIWDILLVRTTENGEVLLNETYGTEGVKENSMSVIQTDDGGFVVAGRSWTQGMDVEYFAMRTDEEGNMLWLQNYGEEDNVEECFSVIETKAGNFLLAGWSGPAGVANIDGYLVMIDGDGEVIWDELYGGEGSQQLFCIRETENEFVIGGSNNGEIWVIKVDENGELIWSQSHSVGDNAIGRGIVSSLNGGFAIGGRYVGEVEEDYLILKINDNGEREWLRSFDVGEFDSNSRINDINKLPDGGYVIVASSDQRLVVVRTDVAGNEQWRRYDDLDDIREEEINYVNLNSVVIDRDGAIVAAGYAGTPNRTGFSLLYKLIPERSSPSITRYNPTETEIEVLLGDTINFAVAAIDLQEDSIRYRWTRNGEEVEPDTVANDTSATTITFDELGIDTVKCVVSDGELADSIRWHVRVTDLYIDSHTPDTLDVSIRRNTTVDFSVTTRAIEGDPVQYEWVHDGEILDEFDDSLSILFEHGRDHEVEVVAYRGEQNDNVIWQITMLDLIINYWPRELDIAVNIDTVMEFSIDPFNPEDPSLDILWTVDDDSIDNRSWTFIDFDAAGEYQVNVYVSDSSSSDSMSWNVMVSPNDVSQNELTLLPKIPTLYPPSPNPFNSQTSVRYALPVAGEVRLELFDVSGRLVAELVDQRQVAGWYDVVIDGNGLVSGVYFMRMVVTDRMTAMKKIVLIK